MFPAPEIFVLVPSYNHAPFIERCLKSIIKQTLKPTKLLIIDDGSIDDSVKIIEQTIKGCPFPAELVVRANRGLCATLNEGFAHSFGKYFAYLGSDDVWLPQFLENRIEVLESRPNAVLAFGHAYLIDENDQIIDCTEDWTLYSDGSILEMLLKGIVPASSSVVYRRSALENERWNESSVLEDYELYLKLSQGNNEFAFAKPILSAWRQHGYNTSGDFAKMFDEWLAAQNRAAPIIGINSAELRKAQSKLKFSSCLDFIRRGEKLRAVQILCRNLNGSSSVLMTAKIILRLLLPSRVNNWYKKQKQAETIERYGKVEI
jgi:alpha-1,3-rhamnosyltransferase